MEHVADMHQVEEGKAQFADNHKEPEVHLDEQLVRKVHEAKVEEHKALAHKEGVCHRDPSSIIPVQLFKHVSSHQAHRTKMAVSVPLLGILFKI